MVRKAMTTQRRTRIRRPRLDLGVSGAIIAISVGVLVPVVLASGVGILAIAIGESTVSLTLGVLVTIFAAAAIGGGVLATVLLGRRARLARLQSDLLANVTHELRTPLSAIRLHAQTLQEDGVADDPEAMARSLGTIVRETEWLESMIDRVLTWRSAEKDMIALDRQPGPIRPTIEDAVAGFEKMLVNDEVEFSVTVVTDAVVDHDPRAITSVIANMLVNAYKYTGMDKRISLRAEDEGSDVVISVADNGIGIPPSEHERIFDPFFRMDSRLRSQAAGAGLGLAIVRQVVRMHEGKVYVKSEQGKGSTFFVYLPALEANP